MKILSIETSCDETAISIVEANGLYPNTIFNILGNFVLSQAELHSQYGGVFPSLAKREHSKNLIPVFKKVLKESNSLMIKDDTEASEMPHETKNELELLFTREAELLEEFLKEIVLIKKPPIDLIAVTAGPGLEPALWVGINFAKALALIWDIPILPVNHMEGHIMSSMVKAGQTDDIQNTRDINFPSIALLISGGHTEIVLMKKLLDYKIIGQTCDDAIGEAFDKVARMLGFPYPGGPHISKLAEKGQVNPEYKLPRPMINSSNYNFSFSGIKTAVLYKLKSIKDISIENKQDLALEFETAVADVLIKKTLDAVDEYNAQTLILGGGVSANNRIRRRFKEEVSKKYANTELIVPDINLSTDNAPPESR